MRCQALGGASLGALDPVARTARSPPRAAAVCGAPGGGRAPVPIPCAQTKVLVTGGSAALNGCVGVNFTGGRLVLTPAGGVLTRAGGGSMDGFRLKVPGGGVKRPVTRAAISDVSDASVRAWRPPEPKKKEQLNAPPAQGPTLGGSPSGTQERDFVLSDPEDLEFGFIVKQERHALRCGCNVCVALRDKVAQVAEPAGLEPDTPAEDPIFVSEDGGFVVGKSAQKHHVFGCHCPNCNHSRFKQASNTAKIVTLDDDLLHALVGRDMCYQQVLDEESEVLRREKIGKANKGKVAWNKGRKHSPETIAKIKAATARAMKDPKVRQKLSDSAAKNSHSESTKFKIRRTVRDRARVKMKTKLEAQSKEKGIRRGKVGVVTIGTYVRRVSGVAQASFGVWTTQGMEEEAARVKAAAKEVKRLEREAKRKAAAEATKLEKEAKKKADKDKGLKGKPKSKAHKAAISAAVKAKWADPEYVIKQKKSAKTRLISQKSASSRTSGSHAEVKRAALVSEMKDIYIKAAAAVKALEARRMAGMEVDEAMLRKALNAVAETRKVLDSVGETMAPAETETRRQDLNDHNRDSGQRSVVHIRQGKEVKVDVDGAEIV